MKCGKLSTQRGFTLMELMLVVAVVAILAAVAVPSYTQYTLRGYRAQAMAELLKYANWMQQQYTINNTYREPVGGGPLILPASESSKYDFAIDVSTPSTFTLSATPKNNDKCGTFTLDNTGRRDVRSGTAPPDAANCWAGR
jgi:type IV pilus assembly protein PilE